MSGISLILRTVVTSWSYCSRGKWRIDYLNDRSHRFEAFRHILKSFHEAYTIFLSGQRIGSHIGSVSWNIQHILWLISSFKQRDVGEILLSFLMLKPVRLRPLLWWLSRFFINASAPSHWLSSVAWPVGPVLKFRDILDCLRSYCSVTWIKRR